MSVAPRRAAATSGDEDGDPFPEAMGKEACKEDGSLKTDEEVSDEEEEFEASPGAKVSL